ncbi:tetratricopeptide repeat protein [Planctellipticum variicoloris]|uniref:tetratricopeptide repeat protein n=1 Tax=Planctellipticum variicoloris TaxID=3064265 RepID=UPI0030133502|nr:hypothetical protein SH412_001555 [Planctomycetaceae bacterium SH412]
MSDDAQPGGVDDPHPADHPPADAPPDEAESAALPAVESDLPEWEPLTPELVEDEAIRGDFVLRWTVVGLALLLGVSQIRETPVLVQIRSGEQLASQGFWPPSTDSLSYTATDRPWMHLSWLWDLATAGVYGLTGSVGLSVWQGLLAATATVLLVHACRPDVRTWWGSICAVLALLACYNQFTLQPEIVTLLGTAALCWWLVRWQERPEDQAIWPMVGILWLWAQLDVRVCLGWGLLLSFGAGLWLSRLLQPSGAAGAGLSRYWKGTVLGILISALHPKLWSVWTAPWRLYALEYPGWRAVAPGRLGPDDLWAFPLTAPEFWQQLNHSTVAALALAVLTAASMILNRARLPLAHVAAFAFANAVAVAAAHELALASIVNAMICTVNAQTWYLVRFGQVYSIRTSELLFSRGGRAVTVLTLFGLAWLTVSGRIDGPDGTRTGVGFAAELQDLMDGYEIAAESEYDDRPFHTQFRQGDLLIWAGRKSFIDSRVSLFYDPADGGILNLHDQTRRAIRELANPQAREAAEAVREVFEKYQITHVMPRLNQRPGVLPDYVSFRDLLSSNGWELSFLGGATAVFHRTSGGSAEYQEFLGGHRFNPRKQAFQDAEPDLEAMPRPWPMAPNRYQLLFSAPESRFPEPMQAAAHYLQMASIQQMALEVRVGCVLIAIRRLQEGLQAAPNSGMGFQLLGQAYLTLEQIERMILAQSNTQLAPTGLRYYQAIGALTQASELRPDEPGIRSELFELFQRAGRLDLALRQIREVQRLTPLSENPSEDELVRRDQINGLESQLADAVLRLEDRAREQEADTADKLRVASSLADSGLFLSGLQILEDDPVLRSQNPAAMMLFGSWLYEAGRLVEAEEVFDALEQTPGAGQQGDWRIAASMVAQTRGDYLRATRWMQQEVLQGDRLRLEGILATLPFSQSSMVYLGKDAFPLMQIASLTEAFQQYAALASQTTLNSALLRLEQGDVGGAKADFRSVLDRAPDSPARPLLRFYWYCLTDEILDVEPPHDWIPITRDTFAAESGPQAGPQ